MTIHTDRITLVFPIAAKNRQAAASLQTLEISESGNEFEKLVPLDPALVANYASQFNLPLLAEIEELKTKHTESITKLNADHAEALQEIQTDLDEANATIATLQAKITELEQYRPYNPRILAGKAFYSRVSKEDMVTLLTSDNAMLVTVGKTIVAYAENDWPVIIDSTDFQNLVGYVLQSGVFDESEVVEIMRDATREEAYRVPG